MSISNNNSKEEIWIGLIKVRARSGNDLLGKAVEGAYVNMMAFVQSREQFLSEIKNALNDYNLDFIGMEDVEPLSKRVEEFNIDEKLVALSEEVKVTGNVRFGTFHIHE